jgi:predicted RNA-binding protein with EMAP domain
MTLLMQMVQELRTTYDINPKNYPTLKPQSFQRIKYQAEEIIELLEDERDMHTQTLKTKDRTIQTLRNCLEETFEKEDEKIYYGILAGVVASTIIYFVILTYVLH